MGVLPRKATANRAMTRPRMAGSERSCSVEFDMAMKAMLAPPMTTRSATATTRLGATATPRMRRPNARAALVRPIDVGRSRLATARPPTTAPAAMHEVIRP